MSRQTWAKRRARRFLRVMAAALAAALLSGMGWPRAVSADDCSLGRRADGVYPLAETDVHLDSELVHLDVKPYPSGYGFQTFVRCAFELVNQGPPTDLLLGFPVALDQTEPEPRHKLEVQEFQAFVDGSPVGVTMEAGSRTWPSAPPGVATWATFKVSFAEGQRRTVVNTYHTVNTSWSTGELEVSYVLTTGQYWAGKIGRARAEFDLGEVRPWQLTGLFPASPWRLEGEGLWVWERADFEPLCDLALYFNIARSSTEYLEASGPEDRAANEELKTSFERVAAMSGDAARLLAEIATMHANLEQEISVSSDLVLACYAATLLPPSTPAPTCPPRLHDLSASRDEAGRWILRGKATDADGDIVALRVQVHRSDRPGETLFERETRGAGTYPRNTLYLDVAAELPQRALNVVFTAIDGSGNVVTSQPVVLRAVGAWRTSAAVGVVLAAVATALTTVLAVRARSLPRREPAAASAGERSDRDGNRGPGG